MLDHNESEMKQKRRFIAGATCPSCSQEDKIVLVIEAHHEFIHCMNCEFIEHRPTNPIQKSSLAKNEQLVTWYPPRS
jgi:uncharacterized metal-binding protein (TIGR02443 family)